MTSSTSGASPHCSRISDRASDGGQSRGPAVRSAGPSSSSRRWAPASPDRRASDLTETVVPFAVWRSRAAKPGPGERAVGRVEVAILELRRADRADRAEPGQLLGEQVAVARGLLAEAVLQLDLDRARGRRRRLIAPPSCAGVERAGTGARAPRRRRERPGRERPLFSSSWVSIVPGRPVSSSVRRHVASGPELPGPPVVREHDLDELREPRARFLVLDRHDGLDPPVEVAVHEVGRADVPVGLPAVREAEDPRVLEELADDRSNRDPVRDARDARQQRAARPADEVDPDAGLGRAIERVDRLARRRSRSP